MNVQLLIDAIVRQTTVLIGQLATAGGVRAPLAHIANEVFLQLVTALSAQGVPQKVIADMFGLALRSYQQKVARLNESATDRGMTLWEAVYGFLKEREVASRQEVLTRFRRDNEASVRGILNDVVASGLVYKTGRGQQTVYRVASEEDLSLASESLSQGASDSLVWLLVYREGPVGMSALRDSLAIEANALEAAIGRLLDEGRIERVSNEGDGVFACSRVLIRIGDEVGWEASVFDHFQAMVRAIAMKLANGLTRALPDDHVGGSTFTFEVGPGHPHEEEVLGLLREVRERTAALWDTVSQHNRSATQPGQRSAKVTFYFGQSVTAEGADTSEENA